MIEIVGLYKYLKRRRLKAPDFYEDSLQRSVSHLLGRVAFDFLFPFSVPIIEQVRAGVARHEGLPRSLRGMDDISLLALFVCVSAFMQVVKQVGDL